MSPLVVKSLSKPQAFKHVNAIFRLTKLGIFVVAVRIRPSLFYLGIKTPIDRLKR